MTGVLSDTARDAGITLYRPDQIAALYRPMRSGDWELRHAGAALTKGYWGDVTLVEPVIALMHGMDTWMSITPMEIESQQIGIDHASGHVVVFGLGMGWAGGQRAQARSDPRYRGRARRRNHCAERASRPV